MHHHHNLGNISTTIANGRTSNGGNRSAGSSPNSYASGGFHGTIGTAAINGRHHSFGGPHLHPTSTTGNVISASHNHLSTMPSTVTSNSHNSNQRNRQQNLSVSTTATAAAALAAINSHFTQHSHHSFIPISNNSSGNNHTKFYQSSHNSHHHTLASNVMHHLHHPLDSLSASSNSSAASSSPSSSPSASISPTSIAPITPTQLGSLMGAVGLTNSYHNQHQQLTTANNLQQQNSNNNGSNNLQQQPQQQQQQQSQQQNTSRYKTELCRPFEENGTCKYGEKCQFAHGINELRTLTRHPKYKTEFCRTFHTTGFCPYGPRCHFIHNSKTPTGHAPVSLTSYGGFSFGQQASHSASPSTSPISSTSIATTANGSASSASSSSSVSPPSPTSRLLNSTIGSANFSYNSVRLGGGINHRNNHASLSGSIGDHSTDNQFSSSGGRKAAVAAAHFNSAIEMPTRPAASSCSATTSVSPTSSSTSSSLSVRNENDEVSHALNGNNGCASETQRLFWLHSHMNESSRWPPAMCASELISGNARRTWQMQA